MEKGKQGFASMSPEKRRAVAARGGSMSGGNFKRDRAKASRAGKVGGTKSRRKAAGAQ